MEITLPAAEQFVSLLLNFGFMQFSKKPVMKDPQIVLYIRIFFVISALLQIAICLYIKRKIASTNCQKKFKYKPTSSIMGLSENEDNEVEISYAEYDSNEATSMLRSVAFQSVLYTVISWKYGNSPSMLILAFGIIKKLLFSPLYRAYIFGVEIERPYEKNLLFPKKAVESVTPVAAAATTVEKKKKKEE